MSKIENPIVLVNIHKNHENSVAVHVTNGSNDWRDVRKGCIADLDEVHPDDAMEKLPLEVLYYTAMALEEERTNNIYNKHLIELATLAIEPLLDRYDEGYLVSTTGYCPEEINSAHDVLVELRGEKK
ncbi:hypothetical protein [Providencia manganoxydans]|uniref:hypothetical protein n=1 Tax=Providencia manganoxydans TaxID=2923283 RepID=UPI0034E475AA